MLLAYRIRLALLFLASFFSASAAQNDSITAAPAPWTLDVAEGWLFVLPPLLSSEFLPPGFARPSEASAEESTGIMTIDPGLILIVRYSSSPVGPYDELIYIPGKWAYADGMEGFRITTIYVSSNESVYNGRENWNIPKHLATFDFQTDILGGTTLSVSSPENGSTFFSVNLLPTTLEIPLEVSLALTGNYLNFVQPPIPNGTLPVEIGTTTWDQFLLNGQTTSVQASLISGALPGGRIGDGVGYPDVQPLLPVGVKLTGTLDFPVSRIFESV
ncbi:hypothetical protein BDP27DRAFT_1318520 [Rhodocollybia butyracea]|uniref:Acetoacetate decarboxylase n=1 Tax=Rhodocollybia butyracea TaxID=206335 RepID=A0A9P5Q2M8_9AGAR|nr:hypothetical protein BDP27DRAFT_1318520 [Rhodocollybia butyracea]